MMVTQHTTLPIAINTRYLHGKMVLDRLAALILLIVLLPVFAIIALLSLLDSRGPVLYRQERVGRGQRPFILFKFRSMKIGTPNLSTADMQRAGINPITRVGGVLRTTSLDELPQLFNILRGEMSFIGPRPALPSQIDVNTLREQHGVHQVRPGITGLAQVMGRDDLDSETKVAYDVEYCRKLSFLFDLRIIVLTIVAIISSRGNK